MKDCDGTELHAGDVLEITDLNPSNEPWRYLLVTNECDGLNTRDLYWNCGADLAEYRKLGKLEDRPEVTKAMGWTKEHALNILLFCLTIWVMLLNTP